MSSAAATPTPGHSPPIVLTVVYDLKEQRNRGWHMACRHASWWGTLYVQATYLFGDRIAVTFHAAPDRRWREWERVRLAWILEDLGQEPLDPEAPEEAA